MGIMTTSMLMVMGMRMVMRMGMMTEWAWACHSTQKQLKVLVSDFLSPFLYLIGSRVYGVQKV